VGGKSIIVKFSFAPDTRTPEGEMLRDIVEVVEKNGEDWVLNLPEVFHYEALPPNDMDVQTRILDNFSKQNLVNMLLQILVMTELFHITELTTVSTLAPVIRDVFKCESLRPISFVAYLTDSSPFP
jgi:hypothetical protein